jgi:hypothetical protein
MTFTNIVTRRIIEKGAPLQPRFVFVCQDKRAESLGQTAEKKVIKKLSMVLAGRIGLEIKTQQIVNLPPDRNEIACLLNK